MSRSCTPFATAEFQLSRALVAISATKVWAPLMRDFSCALPSSSSLFAAERLPGDTSPHTFRHTRSLRVIGGTLTKCDFNRNLPSAY